MLRASGACIIACNAFKLIAKFPIANPLHLPRRKAVADGETSQLSCFSRPVYPWLSFIWRQVLGRLSGCSANADCNSGSSPLSGNAVDEGGPILVYGSFFSAIEKVNLAV
jgi:hypothetical protein